MAAAAIGTMHMIMIVVAMGVVVMRMMVGMAVAVIVAMPVVVTVMLVSGGGRRHDRPRLGVEQPQAETGDQQKAGALHVERGIAHRDRGAAQKQIGRAHQQDRCHALRQRGQQRNENAASELGLVGDHVGRDHRLAVAGAGGMKHAIGKGKADKPQHLHRIVPHRLQRRCQRVVELLLILVDPHQHRLQRAERRRK